MKQWRIALGLTQEQAAHLLGFTQAFISQLEGRIRIIGRQGGFIAWLLAHHPDRAALLRLAWQYFTHQRILDEQLGAPKSYQEQQERLLNPPPVPRPWLLEGAVHESDYPWPGPQPRQGYFRDESLSVPPSPPNLGKRKPKPKTPEAVGQAGKGEIKRKRGRPRKNPIILDDHERA